MKIRISDIMDQVECTALELQERGSFSLQQVREKTLQSIHDAPRESHFMRKIPRMGIAVAALVFCFSITATAGIVIKWSGFAYTDGLSRREKEALLEEAGIAYAGAIVNEIDGSVHYLDKEGNVIMVLSIPEATEYEAARKEASEQAVVESTSLIDVSTLPLIPSSITEMETAEDGQFADIILGNGHMILLHPAGENGYQLTKGDTVTIMLDADSECYLEFRVYLDGNSVGSELPRTQQHCYQFTVAEDGLYNFSVTYGSIGAGILKNGSIKVNCQSE